MKLRAIVSEGQLMPPMFGIAYRRFDRCDRVCYLWPFNWIVRHARNLCFILRSSASLNYREQFEADIHAKSYKKGRREERLDLANGLKRALLDHGPSVMATLVIAITIENEEKTA